MKNAMLINIWICIHFKTGRAVTKLLSVLGLWTGAALKTADVTSLLIVISCRSRSTNTVFLHRVQGAGVQCLLCLF